MRFIASDIALPLNKDVRLVVAVEAPVVLVEAAQSHHLAVINLYCFHV